MRHRTANGSARRAPNNPTSKSEPTTEPGSASVPATVPSTPAGRLSEIELQWLVGYQLAQASIVTIGTFEAVVGGPHGMRTVEYTLLALLRSNPRVSPAQLAKALGLSAPYITTALDKLCRRKLIVRSTNESDRRGQHLTVTPEGDALAAQLTRELLEAERAAFKTLTPTEQMMLAELLHKLARSR